MDNYFTITETPGKRIGLLNWQVILSRYRFATEYTSNLRVLEVGCGAGMALGTFSRAGSRVVGGDVTPENVVCANRTYGNRQGVDLLLFDAHHLPFRDNSFDTILAMAVIYYLDLGSFVRECARVLSPGGRIVFCTPNRNRPDFTPSRFSSRYHSVPELTAILSSNGFDAEYFGAFPIRAWNPLEPAPAERVLIRVGSALLRTLGRVLPVAAIRIALKRALGYDGILLKPEIQPGDYRMVESLPVRRISPAQEDHEHMMIYGVATAR